MAKWGKVDYKQFQDLQKKMEKLEEATKQEFLEACTKELAARLLAKVIKRTPVGDYPDDSGKKGGTLRRGWTTQADGSGSEGMNTRGAKQFVDTLKVHHYGDDYVIEIVNPVHYASYVEYGHRQTPGRFVPAIGKRLKQGWVKGKFMLTISEQEIDAQASKILEKKLMKYLGDVFNDK